MGKNDTQTTSTSSSAPANPDVTATQSKLLKGLQGAYDGGMKVFDKSLYAGTGANTQAGWNTTLAAAGNQDYTNGVSGAISDYADIAAGNRFGTNDPGYAALRAKAGKDTMTDVSSLFTGSGRFGSGSHVSNATESLGNVYAGMDYTNYQNDIARQQQAASALPGLYQASLAPGATMGAVGAAQDADAQAALSAENDLFRRQNDTAWDTLARASSTLAATAPVGGMNTTSSQTSPSTPWWQTLGAGAIGLGSMIF